jgi:hypothetical protein
MVDVRGNALARSAVNCKNSTEGRAGIDCTRRTCRNDLSAFCISQPSSGGALGLLARTHGRAIEKGGRGRAPDRPVDYPSRVGRSCPRLGLRACLIRGSAATALLDERPPPGIGNRHPPDLNEPPPRAQCPPLCGREISKAVRQHDGFGAAVRTALAASAISKSSRSSTAGSGVCIQSRRGLRGRGPASTGLAHGKDSIGS